MAATPKLAEVTQSKLEGKQLSPAVIDAAVAALEHDFNPIDDLRASAWYRMEVSGNLLRATLVQGLEDRLGVAAA